MSSKPPEAAQSRPLSDKKFLSRLSKGGLQERLFKPFGWLTAMALVLAVLVGITSSIAPLFAQQTTSPRNVVSSEPVMILPDRILPPPHRPEIALQLKSYDVEVSVENNIATTTIEQVYVNHSPGTIEAKYLYPLPEGANFSTFTMTINGKAVEGKLMEKEAARKTYQETVQKYIDPGLLEYMDDRTVQLSIAPFFAGEEKRIQLSYNQILTTDGGMTEYRYPFAFDQSAQRLGPIRRPLPVQPMHKPAGDQGKHASSLIAPAPKTYPTEHARLQMNLKTQAPLKTVFSSSHQPKIERSGGNQATVTLDFLKENQGSDKSFTVYFSQDTNEISVHSLAYEPRKQGEDGYFLLSIQPPLKADPKTALPKDVLLVLDTSGSMSGVKIQQAKDALSFILNHLKPEDRFNVVDFHTDVNQFEPALVPVKADTRNRALDYVKALEANGGTNIEGALNTALSVFDTTKPTQERGRYIIFLTDGEPTVGETRTEELVRIMENGTAHNKTAPRLFNFGVGYNINTQLLGKLSDKGHGATTYVEPNEDLELSLSRFYQKIDAPVLTNVELVFQGLKVDRLYPQEVGDLFAGSEVLLLGRYAPGSIPTGQPPKVVLSGQTGSKTQQFVYPVQWEDKNLTRHAHLPRLWAGRRVASLLETITHNGESEELKDEIIALSKQFGILTPYTSFLAMAPDDEINRPGVVTPSPRQHDARYDQLGGGGFSAATAPEASAKVSQQVGRSAVKMQKAIQSLQNQSSVANTQANVFAEADEAYTGAVASGAARPAVLKTVGVKTFSLQPLAGTSEVWVDTAYDVKVHGKPKQITFGSAEYFALIQAHPDWVPYLQLGEALILVTGEREALEIIPPVAG